MCLRSSERTRVGLEAFDHVLDFIPEARDKIVDVFIVSIQSLFRRRVVLSSRASLTETLALGAPLNLQSEYFPSGHTH